MRWLKKCLLLATALTILDSNAYHAGFGGYDWAFYDYGFGDGGMSIVFSEFDELADPDGEWPRCAISPKPKGSLTIPDVVSNYYLYPVRCIGEYAFYDCNELSSVIIPTGVVCIADNAFCGCSNLSEVMIPDGVTSIGAGAFRGCRSLDRIRLPDALTSIGAKAFEACHELLFDNEIIPGVKTVDGWVVDCFMSQPGRVRLFGIKGIAAKAFLNCDTPCEVEICDMDCIGDYAFFGFSGLTNIVMSDSVHSIGCSAFSNCSALRTLRMPNSITNVCDGAFAGCHDLVSVSLSTNLDWISQNMFRGCISLQNISIPNGVTSIGEYAFWNCGNLTHVEIPDSVTHIESCAFASCTNLVQVVIPSNVTYVGNSAFYGCVALTSVYMSRNLVGKINESVFQNCSPELEIIYYDDESSGDEYQISDDTDDTFVYAISNCTATVVGVNSSETTLVIPATINGYPIVTIGRNAFRDCTSLSDITIPSSVTSIGEYAFWGCTNLVSITLPGSVRNIDYAAFLGCTGLIEVSMGNNVTNVGASAFSGCRKLTRITIPDNAIVGEKAFNGCNGLADDDGFVVMRNVLHGYCGDNGKLTIPACVTNIGAHAFAGCKILTDVEMPIGVVNIGDDAFASCRGLTNIIISDSVTDIGASAFYYCSGLTGLTIPNSVVSIGNGAFRGCSGLLNVEIPEGVTNLGYSAFSSCAGLTSVRIPNNVPRIEDDMFYFCENLTNATIGVDVTSIGDRAFYGCRKLTDIILSDSVTNIGFAAFYSCNALTNFCIPNNVRRIGPEAFSGCTKLAAVTIPDNVTQLGNYAFSGCKGLENVVIGKGLRTVGECVFRGCNNLFSITILNGVTTIGDCAFERCSALEQIILPNSVAVIYETAFNGCSSLNRIYLPNEYSGPTNIFPTGVLIIRCATSQCVTFDPTGGQVSIPFLTVQLGQAYGALPVPYRIGYSFVCWAHDGVAITQDTIVSALDNHTLVAQWIPNKYTLVFDANCGAGRTEITQDFGTPLVAPDVMRTGYELTGWCPELPETVPPSNATYIAQWAPRQYMVSFDANGGTVYPSSKTVTYDAAYGTLPNPQLEFCTFEGWHLGEGVVSKSTMVVAASNHVIVAQWDRYGARISAADISGKKLRELYPRDYANLTTIVLSEGVTELPVGFFEGCDNVTSLTLPSTLGTLGYDDLPSKIKNSLGYDENGFMVYQGWVLGHRDSEASNLVLPDGAIGIGTGAFADFWDLETVAIPETVVKIGREAFLTCTYLDNVRIPDSVELICESAFENCSYMQTIDFGAGLKRIDAKAFEHCSSLFSVVLVSGLESIGDYAFRDDGLMVSIAFPHSVTNVGNGAFANCYSLRGVTVPTCQKTMAELFPAAYGQIDSVVISDGEMEVADAMFSGCSTLSSLTWSGSETNIGAMAFSGCTALTDITIPQGVMALGEAAFAGCLNLGNLTLPRNLQSIPANAFNDCQSLDSLVVPGSVTNLGFCFGSGALKAIRYLGNAPACEPNAYDGLNSECVSYVIRGSRDWDGPHSRVLPASGKWNGYGITYWTPNIFDVSFEANGGRFDLSGGSTWSEQQITHTGYVLPSAEPERPGWAFAGWWTEPSGGAQITCATRVTLDKPHTLYAHWRYLGDRMTVSFNTNGGAGVSPETQSYVIGQTFGQFPETSRRGYIFDGWWTEVTAGLHMTEATQVPSSDMELFAHWSPIKYFVRFHANGGTGGTMDEEFTYDAVQELDTHTFMRPGFEFFGWATTPSGQIRYAENASVVNLEETQGSIHDLYAVWSGAGCSIRFDSNGGTGTMNNQTIGVNETQNLWPCAFIRPGYVFSGWATMPSGTVVYRDCATINGQMCQNHENVPLYAVWVSEDETVRVSFNPCGGSVSPDYWDCVIGTAVESFPQPTRPGYYFAGWWTASESGTQRTSLSYVASPVTFYAHWIRHDTDGTPELTSVQATSWISEDLATRYAKSGESATDYKNRFEAKFGSDPVAAMAMPTDKKDEQGNNMYVWQDYVAGTDPTDNNSVFKASIEFVDGAPVVTWSPELPPEQAALRTYTIYGKTNLTDRAWHSPTNEASRFFKVGVEMR